MPTDNAPQPIQRFFIRTDAPKDVDAILNQFGGIIAQHSDGTYRQVAPRTYEVRSITNNVGFLKFAVENQGYAEVVHGEEGGAA